MEEAILELRVNAVARSPDSDRTGNFCSTLMFFLFIQTSLCLHRRRRFAGPHVAFVDFSGIERGSLRDQESSPGGPIRWEQHPEQQQSRTGLQSADADECTSATATLGQ